MQRCVVSAPLRRVGKGRGRVRATRRPAGHPSAPTLARPKPHPRLAGLRRRGRFRPLDKAREIGNSRFRAEGGRRDCRPTCGCSAHLRGRVAWEWLANAFFPARACSRLSFMWPNRERIPINSRFRRRDGRRSSDPAPQAIRQPLHWRRTGGLLACRERKPS